MKQNNNPYPVDVRLRVDLHQTNSTSFRLDTECNRTTDSKIQRGLDSKKKSSSHGPHVTCSPHSHPIHLISSLSVSYRSS